MKNISITSPEFWVAYFQTKAKKTQESKTMITQVPAASHLHLPNVGQCVQGAAPVSNR
jgi:hypothetical protein